jgi:hypothetical protein
MFNTKNRNIFKSTDENSIKNKNDIYSIYSIIFDNLVYVFLFCLNKRVHEHMRACNCVLCAICGFAGLLKSELNLLLSQIQKVKSYSK